MMIPDQWWVPTELDTLLGIHFRSAIIGPSLGIGLRVIGNAKVGW